MELATDATTLVVAGAWNAAILTPAWVLRHGLERDAEGDQGRVQIFLPALQGGALDFPRFSLDEFQYIVRPDSLIVIPAAAPGSFEVAEEAAAKVLSVLVHTPVSGVGHNFEFRDADPDAEHVEAFASARRDISEQIPVGWNSAGASLASAFRNEAGTVQMNVHRVFENGSLTVKFNFHHTVSDAAQAVQVLRGEAGRLRMSANLDLATRLVNSLYGDGNQ